MQPLAGEYTSEKEQPPFIGENLVIFIRIHETIDGDIILVIPTVVESCI